MLWVPEWNRNINLDKFFDESNVLKGGIIWYGNVKDTIKFGRALKVELLKYFWEVKN